MQWASSTATTLRRFENGEVLKMLRHGSDTAVSGDMNTIVQEKGQRMQYSCLIFKFEARLPTKTKLAGCNFTQV